MASDMLDYKLAVHAGLFEDAHTPGIGARIIPQMKRTILVLLTALLPGLAQAAGPAAAPNRTQAERNAVDLKQGMSLDEVQQLLGKPQRTALRSSGAGTSAPWQGSLHWTYVWSDRAASSSSEQRTLSVEFAAKAADQWFVNGWGWNNY